MSIKITADATGPDNVMTVRDVRRFVAEVEAAMAAGPAPSDAIVEAEAELARAVMTATTPDTPSANGLPVKALITWRGMLRGLEVTLP